MTMKVSLKIVDDSHNSVVPDDLYLEMGDKGDTVSFSLSNDHSERRFSVQKGDLLAAVMAFQGRAFNG